MNNVRCTDCKHFTGKGVICRRSLSNRHTVYQSGAWRNCDAYQSSTSLPAWRVDQHAMAKAWSVATHAGGGGIEQFTMVFPAPVNALQAAREAARHWTDFRLKVVDG